MQSIHILQTRAKHPITFRRNKTQSYVLGFKSSQLAHRILYTMHRNPNFLLLPDEPVVLQEPVTQINVVIDSRATFYIPKNQGPGTIFPEDEAWIEAVDYQDFLVYPVTHAKGIIIPFFLITEDDHEYVYNAHVIDPLDLQPPDDSLPSTGIVWN